MLKMVLGRITIDISVRCIPKSEQAIENKPNITKNKKQNEQTQPISGGGKPNTRKQNKKNFTKQRKIHQKRGSDWIWIS